MTNWAMANRATTTGRMAAILLLGLAGALAAPAAPSEAATALSVGYGTAGDFLPLLVAQDKGFLAQHGLDAQLVSIPNGSMSPSAIESGSVQIAFTTPSILILADAGGLDQVAVAGAARLLATNPRSALVTRAGVTVTKPEDLIGKRVGVPGSIRRSTSTSRNGCSITASPSIATRRSKRRCRSCRIC